MVFIESPLFTSQVLNLLTDDQYTDLQEYLSCCPDAGDLMTETGGLRKLRWMAQGRGKRGGTRVIYYHAVSQSQIRMILIYQKGRKDDLTSEEKRALRKMNAQW